MKRNIENLRDHALERAVLAEILEGNCPELPPEHIFENFQNRLAFAKIRGMMTQSHEVSPQQFALEIFRHDLFGFVADPGDCRTDPKLRYFDFAVGILGSKIKGLDVPSTMVHLANLAVRRDQDQAAMRILEILHSTPSVEPESELDPESVRQGQIADQLALIGTKSGGQRATILPLASIDTKGDDLNGITSGFDAINQLTSVNGLAKGQIFVIRAKQKNGKTLTLRSMFYRDLKAGILSLYVTFADITAQTHAKLLEQAHTGWDREPDKMFIQAEVQEKLRDFHENYSPYGFIIDAFKGADDFVIEDLIQILKSRQGDYQFEKVYLDYAQAISSRDKRAYAGETAEQNIIAKKVSRLASFLGIPIIVGAQMTEADKAAGKVAMTKNSRKWEEEAALVLQCNKIEDVVSYECVYNRYGLQSSNRKLVVKDLLYDHRHNQITGQGKVYWETKEGGHEEFVWK